MRTLRLFSPTAVANAVLATALVVLALPGALAPAAGASPTAIPRTSPRTSPAWKIESTPTVGSGSQLQAVQCSVATACMGVGDEASSGTDVALGERWNGSKWSAISTPHPSGSHLSELTGLSCPSATWCMAVGYDENKSVVDVPLAESWNGSAWTVRTAPVPSGAKSSELTSVSCASTSACLAVGFDQKTSSSVTFAEIWNGKTWSAQSPPIPSGAKLAQLHGVYCAGSSYCEAAGNYTDAGNVEEPLAEHWNGKAWSLQRAPAPPGALASAFGDVSCTTGTACTAVGDEVNGSGTEVTLAERWNGSSWTRQGTPAVSGSIAAVMTGVSCTTATACTAVGWYTNTKKVTLALAAGWNGSSWSAQTAASTSGVPQAYLAGVACSAGRFCSAVGNEITSSKKHVALAEEWIAARPASTVTLKASPDPTVTGQKATLTATVASKSAGTGTATGTVTFTAGGTALKCNGKGDAVSLSGGKATCTLSGGFSSAGKRTITAKYGGSSYLLSSSRSLTDTVDRAKTATALTSSANPSVTGQNVTFTATVTASSPGSGKPTGTVTFSAVGAQFGCGDGGAVTLSGGKATCALSSLPPSKAGYTIEATYGGSDNYLGSSKSLTQTVNRDETTVTITSDANPSVYGEFYDLTATVTANSPGSGTPTGTVTFSMDGEEFECDDSDGYPVTLDGGQATCPIEFWDDSGSYTVVADYSGDSDFASSDNSASPYTETVDKAGTTTTLTQVEPDSVQPRRPAARASYAYLVATVAGNSPSDASPPAGDDVTFTGVDDATGDTYPFDCNGTDSNVVPLADNPADGDIEADCTLPADGTYNFTATFDGDSDFTSSSGTLKGVVISLADVRVARARPALG